MLEIRMFLDEDDMHLDKRLDEYIMRYLMHHGVRGASVFSAMTGYGRQHHLHHRKSIGTADEGPLMILFVEEEEKVREVLPHLKEVMRDGLIVSARVDRL